MKTSSRKKLRKERVRAVPRHQRMTTRWYACGACNQPLDDGKTTCPCGGTATVRSSEDG